jgi:hypothetical protein
MQGKPYLPIGQQRTGRRTVRQQIVTGNLENSSAAPEMTDVH